MPKIVANGRVKCEQPPGEYSYLVLEQYGQDLGERRDEGFNFEPEACMQIGI